MFEKGTGNPELGGKLAGLTWGILMGVPIVGMIVVIIMGTASLARELVFLILFLGLAAVNGVLHRKDCEKCKMRFVCPGSAAKKTLRSRNGRLSLISRFYN